ncbi:MAG: hypothetical protein IPN13_03740 [Bacteroidetes bacterium]|nr:hypothetical protein [Bacteroidota bacterium]
MKYKLIGFLFFITFSSAHACDFCNCYLGLNPGYNKNTVGLRYSYRTAEIDIQSPNLRTTHLDHGTTSVSYSGMLKEWFQTTELYARVYPIPQLQLVATMPYSFNILEYNQETISEKAFDDLSVLAFYQVANTIPDDSLTVRHRLFAGAGIKVPTGKYKGDEVAAFPMSDHLFSGTGSYDFLLAVSYIGKYNRLGWNADASIKINGKNSEDYRYGNTLNINPGVFYEVDFGNIKLFPHSGVVFEGGKKDELNGISQYGTGGYSMFGAFGIDAYYGAFSVSTDCRMPFYHNLSENTPEDGVSYYLSLNVHF